MNSASRSNFLRRLCGWKGVAVLAGILALTTLRFNREHELPPMARETIMLQLKADYSRAVLEEMTAAGGNRAALAAGAAELERRQAVTLDKVTVRGILWPKFVRVEVSVNGQPPPDGNPVRYFTIDWAGSATSEVSGAKYHLSLW